MANRTPLYPAHEAAGARIVDFGGWDMPLNYGSQIEEHHAVRRSAGMFDVSHMTVVDVHGNGARDYLSHLLANDVAKLKAPGKALYSCMLNEQGGVVDDLICYFVEDGFFRLVVNAATRDKDLQWIAARADGHDVLISERPDLAMIAVQGPDARERAAARMAAERADAALGLKPFSAAQLGDLFVARTGYTGEDGFEITLPGDRAVEFWNQLSAAGVAPCGLGARDTLRLEAGMNLYGQDMDETTSPLVSGLGWTIAMDGEREFVGRAALEAQKQAGVTERFVGLVLEDRGVLRPGQPVHAAEGEGVTTSGSYSPTLERAIALARIPKGPSESCEVDVRGKRLAARIVRPPFVRNGAACDGILAHA